MRHEPFIIHTYCRRGRISHIENHRTSLAEITAWEPLDTSVASSQQSQAAGMIFIAGRPVPRAGLPQWTSAACTAASGLQAQARRSGGFPRLPGTSSTGPVQNTHGHRHPAGPATDWRRRNHPQGCQHLAPVFSLKHGQRGATVRATVGHGPRFGISTVQSSNSNAPTETRFIHAAKAFGTILTAAASATNERFTTKTTDFSFDQTAPCGCDAVATQGTDGPNAQAPVKFLRFYSATKLKV